MGEMFKDVTGYEGYYQVSDYGNVKSLDRVVKHKMFGLRLYKGRVLKAHIGDNGYRVVKLSKHGKLKARKASSLVAVAFLNHKMNGRMDVVVDHKNNIRSDDRLCNLQLISQRENTSKDQKNGASKYTGVIWHKPSQKWQARIMVNGKRKSLGYFNNERKAGDAYKNSLKQTRR